MLAKIITRLIVIAILTVSLPSKAEKINSKQDNKTYTISSPKTTKSASILNDLNNPNPVLNKRIATNGFADIIENLLPAVVNISTTQQVTSGKNSNLEDLLQSLPDSSILENFKDIIDKEQPQKRNIYSLGSGFVISKDGYIVTNHHVIDQADEIIVNLGDGSKFTAKLIGSDKRSDLALLKINDKKDFKYVNFGDYSKSRIGEWVIAIGNPFGLGGSVSTGIISAKGRNINNGQTNNYMQTDAAINKGNSGGPLFNIKGEVIGVATAIFSPSGGSVGIGFATPADTAIKIISELKEKGEISRGWLGVSIQDVSPEMAESLNIKKTSGAFVLEVVKNSPAEKAGIVATDIIVNFDGQKINKMKDLPKIVANTPIGKTTKLSVFRRGKLKTLKVTIKKLKDDNMWKGENSQKKGDPQDIILGMSLANDKKGVLIKNISRNSPAATKGIKADDVILSANQTKVKNIDDLRDIINKVKKSNRKNILLFIKRENILKTHNITKSETITYTAILPLKK